MVRVAGLKQQLAGGVIDTQADGMLAGEQLASGQRAGPRHGGGTVPHLARGAGAASGRARPGHPAGRQAVGRPAQRGALLLHPRGVSRPHAAGGRPRPSVPAAEEQVAQPGRVPAQERQARSPPEREAAGCGAGAVGAAAPPAGAVVGRPRHHPARAAHLGPRRRPVPRPRRAADSGLPRDAQLGPHHRRGGLGGPPVHGRGGAAPARPRRRRAPADRRQRLDRHRAHARRPAQPELAGRRLSRRRTAAALRHGRADRLRPRAGAALRGGHAGAATASARRRLDHVGGGQARHRAASPVRVVRAGGALPVGGGRRPQRAGHQADPVPDQRRQPVRARAGPCGRERQAGHRAGRDQGPVRRGKQHRLGPPAGGQRRARGLRPHRAQDPLQAGPGGAPRRASSSAATCTSAPATTTRRPRGCTPTCPCSPRARTWPTTSPRSSIC